MTETIRDLDAEYAALEECRAYVSGIRGELPAVFAVDAEQPLATLLDIIRRGMTDIGSTLYERSRASRTSIAPTPAPKAEESKPEPPRRKLGRPRGAVAPKETPEAMREKARELRKNGIGVKKIAEALRVSSSTVSTWVVDLPSLPLGKRPNPRREVARAHRRAGKTTGEIAALMPDIAPPTLYYWICDIPGPTKKGPPRLSNELRARAVDLRKQGFSLYAIAAKVSVSHSTVQKWIRDVDVEPRQEKAPSAPAPVEVPPPPKPEPPKPKPAPAVVSESGAGLLAQLVAHDLDSMSDDLFRTWASEYTARARLALDKGGDTQPAQRALRKLTAMVYARPKGPTIYGLAHRHEGDWVAQIKLAREQRASLEARPKVISRPLPVKASVDEDDDESSDRDVFVELPTLRTQHVLIVGGERDVLKLERLRRRTGISLEWLDNSTADRVAVRIRRRGIGALVMLEGFIPHLVSTPIVDAARQMNVPLEYAKRGGLVSIMAALEALERRKNAA